MASIRNVSGRAIFAPGAGVVADNEVAEVPDDQLYAFTASANFEPVGSDSKTLHEQGVKDEQERLDAELVARRAAMGSVDQPVDEEPTEPAKKTAAKRG